MPPNTEAQLELADGWKEVAPRTIPYRLLYKRNGTLTLEKTDFLTTRELASGAAGASACPIAVDERRQVAYFPQVQHSIERSQGEPHVFDSRRFLDSYSRAPCTLMQISLIDGSSRSIASAPQGLHFNWLLSFLPSQTKLLSLLIGLPPKTDRRLAHIQPDSGAVRLVNLQEEFWRPVAVSERRGEVLFAGSASSRTLCLLDFEGKVRVICPLPAGPRWSAAFHPFLDEVIVSGRGLWRWDLRNNMIQNLRSEGLSPVYSADGKFVWFLESDSELSMLNLDSGKASKMVSLRPDVHTGKNQYLHSPLLTPDGNFLLCRLTGKRESTEAEREERAALGGPQAIFPDTMPESVKKMINEKMVRGLDERNRYTPYHYLCVLDLKKHEIWKRPGWVHQPTWVRAESTA